jgi:hypothetical protein
MQQQLSQQQKYQACQMMIVCNMGYATKKPKILCPTPTYDGCQELQMQQQISSLSNDYCV